MPNMPVISKIEPSHFDAGTAYICADAHLMDNRDPYIFKTTDFGKTWTKITGNLPTKHPLDYARVVAENPNKKGMLFAGTGNALFYTLDDGQTWKPLQEGLPHAAGELGRGAKAGARSRGFHLRPRLLHHARHHAARTGHHRIPPKPRRNSSRPAPQVREPRGRQRRVQL